MNCDTKIKKEIMYQSEHKDRMVFSTNFNVNPILMLSKKITHANLNIKLQCL